MRSSTRAFKSSPSRKVHASRSTPLHAHMAACARARASSTCFNLLRFDTVLGLTRVPQRASVPIWARVRARVRVRVARAMPIRTGKPTCQERSARTVVWRGFGKVLVARHDAQIERPGTSLRKNETSWDASDAVIVGLTRPEASGHRRAPELNLPDGERRSHGCRSMNHFSTSVS